MTKDSICKDCVFRGHIVYEEKGVQRVQTKCTRSTVTIDARGDVKIIICSEYEKAREA